MAKENRNQGEGDRKSAERYNKSAQEFVKEGKVERAARNAGDGDRQEMDRAEEAGKKRAKEFDPAVGRDYSRPTK